MCQNNQEGTGIIIKEIKENLEKKMLPVAGFQLEVSGWKLRTLPTKHDFVSNCNHMNIAARGLDRIGH